MAESKIEGKVGRTVMLIPGWGGGGYIGEKG